MIGRRPGDLEEAADRGCRRCKVNLVSYSNDCRPPLSLSYSNTSVTRLPLEWLNKSWLITVPSPSRIIPQSARLASTSLPHIVFSPAFTTTLDGYDAKSHLRL